MNTMLSSLNAMEAIDTVLGLPAQNMSDLMLMLSDMETEFPSHKEGSEKGRDDKFSNQDRFRERRDGRTKRPPRLPTFRPVLGDKAGKDFERDMMYQDDQRSTRPPGSSDTENSETTVDHEFLDTPHIGKNMLRPEPEDKPRSMDVTIDRYAIAIITIT